MLPKKLCDELYRNHAPSAFRRARRILLSDADAEEVMHDVFLTLFQQPEQYLRAGRISTYLYGAVTHACLNRLRNQRNRDRLAREHHQSFGLASDPGTRPEWALDVSDALERMPEQLAEVAVYYYLDELSHRDIARILGCSHRHVGDLLDRIANWAQQQERGVCHL
jgi:RNA polymerase sigma factor (sigma-70 family)